jgi:D-threo-aldose 1-dehydrogenase
MGCAPLGDLWQVTPDAAALATVEAAYEAGIRFFDTAPWYGLGKSELRLGCGLRGTAGVKADVKVSTKVGRVLHRGADLSQAARWKGGLPFALRFDYTRDGVMRSYEDSLQRLGMNRVDALAIHDLDLLYHGTEEEMRRRFGELEASGYATLEEIVRTGGADSIGAGINRTGLIPMFLERFPLDFFIVAMPYTLLSQEGLAELNLCRERGVQIIVGAPFASGLLASGSKRPASYDYGAAPDAMVAKTKAIEDVCETHGVPLRAAALQFVLAHPAVVSVIPGFTNGDEARASVAALEHTIPPACWAALRERGLVDPLAPLP